MVCLSEYRYRPSHIPNVRITLEIPGINQGQATLSFNDNEELTDRTDTILGGLIIFIIDGVICLSEYGYRPPKDNA